MPSHLVRHVTIGEDTEVRETSIFQFAFLQSVESSTGRKRIHAASVSQCQQVETILAKGPGGGIWQEEGQPSAQHNVGYPSSLLADGLVNGLVSDQLVRDLVLLITIIDVRRKHSWGSVSDAGGDDETGLVAGEMGRFEDGSDGISVLVHRDGTVVGLDSGRIGSSSRGGVGHVTVR